MISYDIVSVGLRKRGKVYVANIRYKIGDKTCEKRRSLKTKSLSVAKAKINDINKTLHDPLHKNRISELLQGYIERSASRSRKENHVKKMSLLRKIFGVICEALEYKLDGYENEQDEEGRPVIDVTFIQDINSAFLDKYFNNVIKFSASQFDDEDSGISPTTLNRMREEIRAFINYSMNIMKVKMPGDVNPIKSIEKFNEIVLPIIFLKRAKIAEQLFKIRRDVRLQTMIAVMIFAGLRREELLLLQHRDICLENNNIIVQAKELKGRVWVPKNKTPRVVPISKRLAKYLKRYIKTLPKNSLWLFPANDGERWIPDTFSKYLRESNAAVELSWSCNEYRHTFGSHLAKKNVSLLKISKLMGNSLEICEKHYACLIPSELRNEVEY